MAEEVLFTERCEEAIVACRLNELLIELESQLDTYTNTQVQVWYGMVTRRQIHVQSKGLFILN